MKQQRSRQWPPEPSPPRPRWRHHGTHGRDPLPAGAYHLNLLNLAALPITVQGQVVVP